MLYIITIIIVLAAGIILRSRYETHNFKIKEYRFSTDKVTEEIKFGFITDLHNCLYGEKNESVIKALEREKCSFLIIGGDLISGKRNIGDNSPLSYYSNAADFLNGLSGKMPIFYTFGNHETRVRNRQKTNPLYRAYMNSIRNAELEMMNNRMYRWNQELIITGLEIDEASYDNENSLNINKNLFCHDEKAYRILVAHSPEFFGDYAKEDADLILCGHNHGGTVRLPVIGGVVSRDYKLFPKYSYGVYEKNGKKMVLTSGLGDHTIHFRLFNMPEVVVITLIPEKVFEKEEKSVKM